MNGHLNLLLLLVCLVSFPVTCVPPPQQQIQKPETSVKELQQHEILQFSGVCSELRDNLTEAIRLSSDVAEYDWAFFSDIDSKYGTGSALLPDRKEVVPIINKLNACLDYAGYIIYYNPYTQKDTLIVNTEKMSVDQWLEQSRKLEKGIDNVKDTVSYVVGRANKKFTFVELGLSNSTKAIQNEYSNRFKDEKLKYLNTLNKVNSLLTDSQTLLAKLIGWKFSSFQVLSPMRNEYADKLLEERIRIITTQPAVDYKQIPEVDVSNLLKDPNDSRVYEFIKKVFPGSGSCGCGG